MRVCDGVPRATLEHESERVEHATNRLSVAPAVARVDATSFPDGGRKRREVRRRLRTRVPAGSIDIEEPRTLLGALPQLAGKRTEDFQLCGRDGLRQPEVGC